MWSSVATTLPTRAVGGIALPLFPQGDVHAVGRRWDSERFRSWIPVHPLPPPSSWSSTPRRTGWAASAASSRRSAPSWSAAASCTTAGTRSWPRRRRCRAASSASPGSRRRWSTRRRRAERRLPELAALMRGPRARCPLGGVRPARAAPGVRARGPRRGRRRRCCARSRSPRRFAPLVRQRRLRCARGLARDRRRGPAPRAGRRGDLRARVLRAVRRGCAPTRDDDRGGAGALTRPARPRRVRAGGTDGGRSLRGARKRRPDVERAARRARRLHLPQRGGPAAVRRQVGHAAHARAGALRAVVGVDGLGDAGRAGRPPRDALGARRAAARAPADPRAAPAGQRAASSTRTASSTCAAASTSRFRCSRCRRSRRPATRSTSGRCAGATLAAELVEQLNSLFGLRHCGRKLPRRDAPVGLRADGPLPVAVPGRPRPERLPRAGSTRRSRCSPRAGDAAGACSPTSTRRCARPRASSASSARPGCGAGASGSRCCSCELDGVLAATHARPRLVLAEHPRGGRVRRVLARRRAGRRLGRR